MHRVLVYCSHMVVDSGEAGLSRTDVRPVRWLEGIETLAWRAFIDANYRLMDTLNRELQVDRGLTMAEYRILVKLSEAPEGSLRMSLLADGVLSSRSRLTHQIRRMEEQQLVVRDTCSDDGRGVLAVITDQGRATLAAAAPAHVDAVRRYMIDLLTVDELETIAEVFEKVDARLVHQAL